VDIVKVVYGGVSGGRTRTSYEQRGVGKVTEPSIREKLGWAKKKSGNR